MSGRRTISPKDIYEVPRLVMQGVFAWLLPEAAWHPASRIFGKINAATHPTRTRRDASRIAAALGDTVPADRFWGIAAAIWENRYEERFQYMRAWRPGGWNPQITIAGDEHVRTALRHGRGIMFWGSNFSFNDLVTKMAWHRLELHVHHFSRPTHGFSETRFGVRYLNAVRRKIEDRYLGARLMTEEQDTRATLDRLRNHLRENGAVSFTVGERGRHRAQAKFVDGKIELATGPLFLAHSVGATVLPMFTLRKGPGRFEVTIGPPLEAPAGADGEPDFAAVVQEYADRLAPYVLQDPGQWKGWRFVCNPERLP